MYKEIVVIIFITNPLSGVGVNLSADTWPFIMRSSVPHTQVWSELAVHACFTPRWRSKGLTREELRTRPEMSQLLPYATREVLLPTRCTDLLLVLRTTLLQPSPAFCTLCHQCSTTKANSQTRVPAIYYYLRVLFGSHHWCSPFVSSRECLGIPFAKQSRPLRQNSRRFEDSLIRIRYRIIIRPEAPKQLRPD